VLATWHGALCGRAQAAEGSLQLIVRDEKAAAPVQSRLEVWPADQPDQLIALPNTVSAGIGFVVDRRVKLELPAGEYRYQLTRGPEYRVVRGGFSLTNSSRDRKLLYLPRIDDMRSRGWTSGDCCVPGPIQHLPLRMAAVDLHMVGVLRSAGSDMAEDLAGAEPIDQQPRWITDGLASHGGLLFYGTDAIDTKKFPIESILATKDDSETHVAIENPFAWPLPIWLASGQVNGFFVLGDWTRLDQRVEEVPSGRGVPDEIPEDARAVGRWADLIYMRALDAGLRLVPLAGSGNARGMAGGVSKATLPTMAGMVAALSGMLFSIQLRRWALDEGDRVEDGLDIEHGTGS